MYHQARVPAYPAPAWPSHEGYNDLYDDYAQANPYYDNEEVYNGAADYGHYEEFHRSPYGPPHKADFGPAPRRGPDRDMAYGGQPGDYGNYPAPYDGPSYGSERPVTPNGRGRMPPARPPPSRQGEWNLAL